jgi:Fic-DOC domain mobile mystery protein B
MTVFFINRTDQTPLEESMYKDLRISHVQNMAELYEHEIENIAEGIAWLRSSDRDYRDYTFWLEIHKRMLSKVWKWAGQIRKRELANPDFLMPYEIRPALLQLEGDIKFWLAHKTFSEKEFAAVIHERFLTIHPFNDGNGRWSRVLTEHICRMEKIEIPSWGRNIVDDEERRKRYIAAVKKARRDGDPTELMNIMFRRDILSIPNC